MIVAVTGGRKNHDPQGLVAQALDHILNKYTSGRLLLVQGGALGIDAKAFAWARAHGQPVLTWNPDWDVFGPGAGNIRNGEMLEGELLDHLLRPQVLLSFPGGSGTEDCTKKAYKLGVRTFEINSKEDLENFYKWMEGWI